MNPKQTPNKPDVPANVDRSLDEMQAAGAVILN